MLRKIECEVLRAQAQRGEWKCEEKESGASDWPNQPMLSSDWLGCLADSCTFVPLSAGTSPFNFTPL